jgi:hypothetical protein
MNIRLQASVLIKLLNVLFILLTGVSVHGTQASGHTIFPEGLKFKAHSITTLQWQAVNSLK